MIDNYDPRTLSLTVNGITTVYPNLEALMKAHSKAFTDARPHQPGDRKAVRRAEKMQAGIK